MVKVNYIMQMVIYYMKVILKMINSKEKGNISDIELNRAKNSNNNANYKQCGVAIVD